MIYSVRNPNGGFDLYEDGEQLAGPPRPRAVFRERRARPLSQVLVTVPPQARFTGHSPGPLGRVAVQGFGDDAPEAPAQAAAMLPQAAAPAQTAAAPAQAAAKAQDGGGILDDPNLAVVAIFAGTYLYYRLLIGLSKELFS